MAKRGGYKIRRGYKVCLDLGGIYVGEISYHSSLHDLLIWCRSYRFSFSKYSDDEIYFILYYSFILLELDDGFLMTIIYKNI